MAEMTPEQQRALAIARARRRRMEQETAAQTQATPDAKQVWNPEPLPRELTDPAFNFRQNVSEFAANVAPVAAGRVADDFVRRAANSASLGMADRLAAGGNALMGQGDYSTNLESERDRTDQAKQNLGAVGTIAADTLGTAGAFGLLAKTPLLASRYAPQVAQSGKDLLKMIGAGAVDGSVIEAAQRAGMARSNPGEAAASGIVPGALAGAAGPLISSGVGKIVEAFQKRPSIPTLDAVQQAADDAYARADASGLIVGPDALSRVKQKVEQELTDFGYHPDLNPRAKVALGEVDRLQGKNSTLKGIDVARRIAGTAASTMDRSDARAAMIVKNAYDDILGDLRPNEIVAGDPLMGVNALKEARDMTQRAKKMALIDDAAERATRRAASTGSGGNIDNALRQNIRSILDSPKKSRGFTADEKNAMEAIVRGETAQNVARLAGKLSPSGNGLMAALGLGATAMNPLFAAAPAVGMVAKSVSDRGTSRNIQRLTELILAGGDSAAITPAKSGAQKAIESPQARKLLSAFGLALN